MSEISKIVAAIEANKRKKKSNSDLIYKIAASIDLTSLEVKKLEELQKIKGDRGEFGAVGPMGPQGIQGLTGRIPNHTWNGTKLQFELPDGTWGLEVDLQGKQGTAGGQPKGGGASHFYLLRDVPSSYASQSGKSLRVKTTEDGLEFYTPAGNGTVTSVAALTIGTTGTDLSSTVATGTTTPVITLQVPTASAINRGALSSADWSTFNSKAAALSGTINEIAYFNSATTITSLAVATYPSLTEISYVKGLTSAIQTQLGLKAPLASPTFTGPVTVPEPTNGTDAVTKNYVDALKAGLDIKDSVRVASTANIAIATALTNGSTIDGVVVSTGDRVLLKNQTAPAENGIYVVVASGAASRSTDANISAEVTSGMYVFVSEGTASADMGFVLTTNDPITLDTTSLSFTQFSGAGQITAGNGLTKTGNTLTIDTAITADLSTAQALSNKTLTAPKIADTGYIADASGNEQIKFSTTASAVNEVTVKNAATGTNPQIQATGGDTNIGIDLVPKGTGIVKGELKRFMVQLLSETTNQTVATTFGGDFRISNRAITVKAVGSYCDTAGTTGTFTVDINEAGVSILSTKITVDSTEKSSETAATAPVISDSAIAADAIITFDIDAIQTTAAKGLKVWIDFIYA